MRGRSGDVLTVSLVVAFAAAACGGGANVSLASPSSAAGASASPSANAGASGSARSCTDDFAPGDRHVALETASGTRDVLVHVPRGLPDAAVPAVVAFHGYSSRADELAPYSGLSMKADAAGFIAVYPQGQGTPPQWHIAVGYPESMQRMDRDLAASIVDWLRAAGCVDMTRVYLAGHSQGGGMAGDLACEMADRFAGVALIEAVYYRLPCEASRPIPVVAFHALDDNVLPYEGGHVDGTDARDPKQLPVEDVMKAWASMNGCSGPKNAETMTDGTAKLGWTGCNAPVLQYRLPFNGHRWPPTATALLWAFFESSAA